MGSCRIQSHLEFYKLLNGKSLLPNNYKINNNSDYVYTTKEIIQYLKIFSNIIDYKHIPFPQAYDFNHDKRDQRYKILLNILKKSKTIIFEISSIKIITNGKYFYQNYRYNDNIKTNDKLKKNTFIYTQTKQQFIDDLLEIIKLVDSKIISDDHKKNIIFVSHLNVKTNNGTFIKNRELIDLWFNEFIKHDIILRRKHIFLLTPGLLVNDNNFNVFFNSKNDLEHPSIEGYKIIREKLSEIIQNFK